MKSIRTSCATPLPSQASSYAPLPSGAAQDDSLTRPPAQYYDENQPMSAKWVPYSSTCEPATDWLALIANRDVDSLSWLANRTILVLGDSVDRNGLHHFAEMLGLPRYCVPYDDFGKKGQVPAGWDERGIPWVIEIPWTNTYFTNGFMYGLVSQSCYHTSEAIPVASQRAAAACSLIGLGLRSLAPPASRARIRPLTVYEFF